MNSLKLAVISILLISLSALYAGELEPPGPPQSTMKPLNLVEPRTALVPNGETISIDAPGSYYLTGNLTVQDANGIEINADRVTLDLNGFTITGNDFLSNQGIDAKSRKTIIIKNGLIKGFFYGVGLDNSSVVIIDHMQISAAQDHGLRFVGDNTIIANSNIANNGGDGVVTFVENKHIMIRDSRVVNNGINGIDFDVLNGVNNGMLIKNCVSLNNGDDDIEIQNGLVVESIYQTIDEVDTTDIVDSNQVN